MSEATFGQVMAEIMSEPGQPSEVKPEQTTAEVLQSMLTENTGRHILDSGGAYGRAWEKNQGVDFDAKPEVEVEWRTYEASKYSKRPEGTLEWELMAYIDVYHFLLNRLEYNAEVDAEFREFGNSPEHKDEYWLETMEAFAAEKAEGTGDYGRPYTVNTYNHESHLSQTLQYTVWTDAESDDVFVALQIHGGADVRGGYTAPRIFNCYEMHELSDDSRIEIACDGSGEPDHNPGQLNIDNELYVEPGCRANWTDEGGYDYLFDGGCPVPAEADLATLPVEEGTEGKRGVLVVNSEDNEAYCPLCGKGKLNVYGPIACG